MCKLPLALEHTFIFSWPWGFGDGGCLSGILLVIIIIFILANWLVGLPVPNLVLCKFFKCRGWEQGANVEMQ